MKKKDVIATIKESISENDRAAVRALQIIFARQTYEEVRKEEALLNNGIGFTGRDAEILTSFALQYKSRGFLSPNQLTLLRRKMVHYSAQLLDNAIQEGKIIKHGRSDYQVIKVG